MQNAETKQEDKSYMRMREIQEMIPVSVGTLYNYAKRGILTPIKISDGVTVYDRNEVMKLLGNQPEGTDL